MDINTMTSAQLKELAREQKKKEIKEMNARREAYESLREECVEGIKEKLTVVTMTVNDFNKHLREETSAFFEIMREYGMLRPKGQDSFTLTGKDFKVEVKYNKVKGFDERATIAAASLVEFLNDWIKESHNVDDPMYGLAMLMIERNDKGDFNNKNIGYLYEQESKFNSEKYTEIMNLFRESHCVRKTCFYYTFEECIGGVWRKIEPSFNRL